MELNEFANIGKETLNIKYYVYVGMHNMIFFIYMCLYIHMKYTSFWKYYFFSHVCLRMHMNYISVFKRNYKSMYIYNIYRVKNPTINDLNCIQFKCLSFTFFRALNIGIFYNRAWMCCSLSRNTRLKITKVRDFFRFHSNTLYTLV